MVTRGTREVTVSVVGALTLVVGAYLRWTHPPGDTDVVAFTPTMLVDNMHRGFELGTISYDVMVLAAAVLALVALGFTTHNYLRATATLLSGVIPVVMCVQFLGTEVVSVGGTWTPALGWYLTLLGGVLLLVNGGLLAVATSDPRHSGGVSTN